MKLALANLFSSIPSEIVAVSSSKPGAAKLSGARALMVAMLSPLVFGCATRDTKISYDPKLARDQEGRTVVVDEFTDSRNQVIIPSVDDLLVKVRLGKVKTVDYSYDPKLNPSPFYKVTLTNNNILLLPIPKDSGEHQKLIRGLKDLGPIPIYINVKEASGTSVFYDMLMNFGPDLMWALIIMFIINEVAKQSGKEGSISSILKKKKFDPITSDVRFSDVRGNQENVRHLRSVVDLLEKRKTNSVGATIPRGVLLTGPSGTGKTLMAKAIAGEIGAKFFSVSGSEFVELFVGQGAKRARDLFAAAKENNPAVIFIDELDAVGKQRGQGSSGGNDEREQTLNQILIEMDGFKDNSDIIVIAATNRPEVLDPALLRPGRFDYELRVVKPVTAEQRRDILELYINRKVEAGQMVKSIDPMVVAEQTPGFSPAELKSVIDKAAVIALQAGKKKINMQDIEHAIRQVSVGMRTGVKPTDKALRTVAIHEIGHYLTGKTGGTEFVEICFEPTGQALGFVKPKVSDDDELLGDRNSMLKKLVSVLGGRAAEQVFGETVTFGADGDQTQARTILRRMLTANMLGNFCMTDYNDESIQLSDADEQLAKRVYNAAQAAAEQILSSFERTSVYALIGEVIDRTIIRGEEADNIAFKHLEDAVWSKARSIMKDFVSDPKDSDGSIIGDASDKK